MITAARPIPNPTPFIGRTESSFVNPVTSLIWTGASTGGGPITVPDETRTSRTRREIVLGGTAQISVNWSMPWLLYVTVYCAPADAVVVGTSCTRSTPFTIGNVRFAVAILDVSPARKLLYLMNMVPVNRVPSAR